jgi:hypothetical protein
VPPGNGVRQCGDLLSDGGVKYGCPWTQSSDDQRSCYARPRGVSRNWWDVVDIDVTGQRFASPTRRKCWGTALRINYVPELGCKSPNLELLVTQYKHIGIDTSKALLMLHGMD